MSSSPAPGDQSSKPGCSWPTEAWRCAAAAAAAAAALPELLLPLPDAFLSPPAVFRRFADVPAGADSDPVSLFAVRRTVCIFIGAGSVGLFVLDFLTLHVASSEEGIFRGQATHMPHVLYE